MKDAEGMEHAGLRGDLESKSDCSPKLTKGRTEPDFAWQEAAATAAGNLNGGDES